MTFAQHVIQYFANLTFNVALPDGVEAMNPYLQPSTMDAVTKYYTKFFNDTNPRTFIVGINPGRFGAGITGISFTDTVRLEQDCGISHELQPTTELSSEYIYSVIEQMGGPQAFFSRFYLTSLSPIGFTRDGKNYNYYDSPALLKATLPYMEQQLARQLAFGANPEVAFSLGSGKNLKYLREVNRRLGNPFREIVAINHPRYVMQYRRKHIDTEKQLLIDALNGSH